MIEGVVNPDLEATVHLRVRGPSGQEHEIEAIVDTGFTGALTMSASEIAQLQLPWQTRSIVILANGADVPCDVYSAVVIWDDRERDVLVEEANTVPLIGMRLLRNHRLHIDVLIGGVVVINPLE